jgi:hypothetical protein
MRSAGFAFCAPVGHPQRKDGPTVSTETTTTDSDNGNSEEAAPGDQLLWGAQEIASFIDRELRETFYLLEKKRLPATKIGNSWVSSHSVLRRFFNEKLEAALAAALAAKLEPATEPVAPVAPKKRAEARSSTRHGRRAGRVS